MMTLGTMAILVCGFGGTRPNCATCNGPSMNCAPGGFVMTPPRATGPCPPIGPPAAALAAKVIVPDGVRITAFPGTVNAKSFSTSALFAFRPGYVYRLELSNISGKAENALFPEIEVRGTLALRASMSLMESYAAINFSQRDLDRAAAGTLITKVIYLEDPEKAVPAATTQDKLLEIPEDTEEDAIKAALDNGRLVMIVRLGNRRPTNDELTHGAIPGTVLLPGENHLALPASPPTLGWQGVPLYDPLLGPKFPHEECLTDGGDTGPRLGVRDDGRLGGLNPTDTSAEYSVGGKAKVTTSNTVCICAPRFVVRRCEQGASGVQVAQRPEAGVARTLPGMVAQKTPPMVVLGREMPASVMTMIHAQIIAGRDAANVLVSRQGLRAVYQVESSRIIKAFVEPQEVQNADDFLLTKEVDPKANVKVGDEVTITLRYANHTGKPVTDVVVSDSLSGRLEYIPGTTASDRPTNVTTTANDVGSVIVRFELPGTLQPGQGGVVKFKVKVR